ncbi:uncharacterized protein LOC113523249 isoform X2 [Galleria mellonella]|uniref:Uncharacterized protein LOC113523249 isoform X2 n=1 Tax=Galleria mellonella TaxID=7137 RepID=A0A6J1X500_GALME|nr:uncharacterized protein LOC113523249 isoform X2 [Galleria mellonella]
MFGRPRCREWTPLATQQLRLRSLIQIVGYNIRPPEWSLNQCSFYLTLHHTTMSAPFYTSEKISSPHPKWKEIDSEITHRMASTNIVIRIWCHQSHTSKVNSEKPQDTIIQTWGVYFSGLRYLGANLTLNFTSDCFKSNTLVFQMHGGYFCSYKSLKLDVIPPENELEQGSLSSDSSGRTNLSKITLEPKFIQNHKVVKETRSVSPSIFSRKHEKEYSKSNSPVEKGFKQNFLKLKSSASLNISQRESYTERECDFDRDSDERIKDDPNYIYEHSPDSMDVKEFTTSGLNCFGISKTSSQEDLSGSKIDLSEIAENYDLRNETVGVPKYRYLAINFLKSEIRPSYNATKLQKLHLLQYSIKKRQEAVQEVKERIYSKSAVTNDSWPKFDEFDVKTKLKSRSLRNLFSPDEDDVENGQYSSHSDISLKNGRIKEEKPVRPNGPRLALKLNDLLSFKAKPSPFQRAEHVRLTKQLEILRFKRIILSDERDSKLANIRRLKERHAKLLEENQDIGLELMQNYHTLSRWNESMKETRQSCAAMRDLAARSHAALLSQRHQLLLQLHQIFYIQQKDTSVWTICGVRLPICGDENPSRASNPVSDSVAAGFVAQATCLAASFLNQPLRYKITLLGSASKILDITPELPNPNIPLFTRGGDTTLFPYAMFLLNKCIAQLLWGRGLPVPDMRPTLKNLERLLTTPNNLSDTSKLFGTYKWRADGQCPRTQSLRSLVASDRGKYRQFNRFKDAVDGQSPHSAMNLKRHRQSRSVGSYNDDQEMPALDASTTSIMGSESNIYNLKLIESNSSENLPPLKSHNSDSEILRLLTEDRNDVNTENKVIFTLGDDTSLVNIESEKLLRISTNNDDEITCSTCLDENVKRICSEIENFCSTNTEVEKRETKDLHEGFDVVRHIEAMNEDIAKYIEQKSNDVEPIDVTCETCADKDVCDIACAKNVTEVIVIPSAEAILDTLMK